jgi:hypothetical protein
MLIGVISDTHDRAATMSAALYYFHERHTDIVIHCGDWKSIITARYFADIAHELKLPVRGVLGNNDLDVDGFMAYAQAAPGDFRLYAGVFDMPLTPHRRLAAYHGHHKPTLRNVLQNEVYSTILLGHSHKPRIEHVNDKLIVNPGSTAFSIPRSKSWRPSVAIIDTEARRADIVYLP